MSGGQQGPRIDVPDPAERAFHARLAHAVRELEAAHEVELTLQRIVDLAADLLGGEISASISLVRDRRTVETPACSSEDARRADLLQYELGEGPCLSATHDHEVVQIDDLDTDERFPGWSTAVVRRTGFRSILSFRLFTAEGVLGALNLYAPRPRAFDAELRGEGFLFAAQAAVTLQAVLREENLRTALITRSVIGQAQGILMERFGISAEQAFRLLSRISQAEQVKIRDLAQRVVDTRETPGQP